MDEERKVVICGDLNMKSLLWSALQEYEGDKYVSEWMGTLELVAVKDGKKLTIRRGERSASYIHRCNNGIMAGDG